MKVALPAAITQRISDLADEYTPEQPATTMALLRQAAEPCDPDQFTEALSALLDLMMHLIEFSTTSNTLPAVAERNRANYRIAERLHGGMVLARGIAEQTATINRVAPHGAAHQYDCPAPTEASWHQAALTHDWTDDDPGEPPMCSRCFATRGSGTARYACGEALRYRRWTNGADENLAEAIYHERTGVVQELRLLV